MAKKFKLRPGYPGKNYREIEKDFINNNKRILKKTSNGEIPWNPATEPNPAAVEEGAKSREHGFLHHPSMSKLGRFFQQSIKKSMISSLEKIHRMIPKYDKQAFVFDDPRLKYIHDFSKEYTSAKCKQSSGRPARILMLALEICLFLMKEDIYYRARFFDAWNKFHDHTFELTEREKENLTRD